MLVVDVHAARRLVEGRVEGPEALADRVELQSERERHRGGEHRVLHVVRRAALERGRDQVRPDERDVAAAVVERDHLAVDARLERAGAPARADVLAHERVLRVHRDVADVLGVRVRRHLEHERVVRVQHGAMLRDLDDDALHLGELLERVDALEPEVIGLHVQHGADVHLGDAHAGAQEPAARGLEHGRVDVGVGEHHACGDRTRHVAGYRPLPVDVHAVRRREARRVAGHLQYVREHACRRRLAVRAGDRGDRHARGRAGREQHVDDRAGGVPRRALGRRHVHAEPGRGIDLADAATDFAVGQRDVLREEVDAADIKADRLDRAHRHVAVVRVDDVRDVGRRAARREVRGRAQVHLAPGLRHRLRREPGARKHHLGLVVDLEAGQDLLVADAAPRILVHDLDQLVNVCVPSPVTWPGVRRVAAINSPFTTSSRWSSPSR